MAHRSERLNAARLWASRRPRLLIALGVMALLALLAWPLLMGRSAARPASQGVEQSIVVTPGPFAATLSFAGVIVAGDGAGLAAPFDGTVTALGFRYGDRVEAGQMLIRFDTVELDRSRNEAEATYVKALETAETMDAWSSGPEMSRARRALAAAELDAEDVRRRLQETRALFDDGLVPRSELDSLMRQDKTQAMALAGAQEDLESARRRGTGASRRVSTIELQNARSRLEALDAQRAQAALVATSAGVIVRPPMIDRDTRVEARPGVRVTKGQLIGTIIEAGDLFVTFSMNEGDINRLKPGQAVQVTSPGFAGLVLKGVVSSVAGEAAAQPSPGAGPATFPAVARLVALTPEQASRIRIGMTASVVVTAYESSSAIVVPPEAVEGGAGAAFVTVRAKDGAHRKAAVQVGQVAPQGVEILSGLKPGDVVIWTTASPTR